ncbi:hypothetical protein HAX54_037963, partial [Datura stramonium]|nr:hypothetical protein [Datura stramonium]
SYLRRDSPWETFEKSLTWEKPMPSIEKELTEPDHEGGGKEGNNKVAGRRRHLSYFGQSLSEPCSMCPEKGWDDSGAK